MSVADTLTKDMQSALRAGDKLRLGILRLALAAIQQREVDSREKLSDDAVLRVIEKLIKQGRDAERQYADAGREQLAAKEAQEIEVLQTYLPAQLSSTELDTLVAEVIAATGATSIKDMGKIMGAIKSRAAGRADMSEVNTRVRAALNAE